MTIVALEGWAADLKCSTYSIKLTNPSRTTTQQRLGLRPSSFVWLVNNSGAGFYSLHVAAPWSGLRHATSMVSGRRHADGTETPLDNHPELLVRKSCVDRKGRDPKLFGPNQYTIEKFP
jgi:hypothetical protein